MEKPTCKLKDRLREAMRLADMKAIELSDLSGIPKSSISQYLSGYATPKSDRIYTMSRILNVNPVWLMGYNVPIKAEKPTNSKSDKSETTTDETFKRKGVKIPVLGEVAAGVPLEAIEDIIDYEEITEEMAQTGEFFGLKIKGDSMYPRICDGDVVIVRQQNSCDTGDVVVVLVNGEAATVKKIRKQKDGIMLIPFNTSFEPMFFSNEEIQDLPVNVIGKVIELRGKF